MNSVGMNVVVGLPLESHCQVCIMSTEYIGIDCGSNMTFVIILWCLFT